MKSPTVDSPTSDLLAEIRQELARLADRVSALEALAAATPASASSATPVQAEGLNDELVLTISAAIAAYLGKKPHIRQIRLLGGASWAQQGRASVQASHALTARHGK